MNVSYWRSAYFFQDYYCATCYQSNFGTTCFACNKFVEGEVVTALGKTYHQKCFRCANCDKTFPTGERVTFTGKSCLCTACAKLQTTTNNATSPRATDEIASQSPIAPPRHDASDPIQKVSTAAQKGSGAENQKVGPVSPSSANDKCAGCAEELKEGQALMALDKQVWMECYATPIRGKYLNILCGILFCPTWT